MVTFGCITLAAVRYADTLPGAILEYAVVCGFLALAFFLVQQDQRQRSIAFFALLFAGVYAVVVACLAPLSVISGTPVVPDFLRSTFMFMSERNGVFDNGCGGFPPGQADPIHFRTPDQASFMRVVYLIGAAISAYCGGAIARASMRRRDQKIRSEALMFPHASQHPLLGN